MKTICEEEEWKEQFEPIKKKFAKCLGLNKILTDESDGEVDRTSFMSDENYNPYCKYDEIIQTIHFIY